MSTPVHGLYATHGFVQHTYCGAQGVGLPQFATTIKTDVTCSACLAAWSPEPAVPFFESVADRFARVWAATGYQYGPDALENVRLGFHLASPSGPAISNERLEIPPADPFKETECRCVLADDPLKSVKVLYTDAEAARLRENMTLCPGCRIHFSSTAFVKHQCSREFVAKSPGQLAYENDRARATAQYSTPPGHSPTWEQLTPASRAMWEAGATHRPVPPEHNGIVCPKCSLRFDDARLLAEHDCGHRPGEDGEPAPWQPETDKVRLAVLGKALEEAGELITIMARCIIQGVDERNPNGGKPNIVALREELADVHATLRHVQAKFTINMDEMTARRDRKGTFLAKWFDGLRGSR